jgi:hypothetical protein
MAEHPNVATVRRGYEAFSKGDMETLRSLMTEDCVHHVPGKSQIAGDYKGVDQVLGLYAKFFELTGGTLKVDLHDAVGNDEHVITMHRLTANRTGKILDTNEALVFHFRGGKISELFDAPSDQYAQDAFWG